jgi:hypothetical protein
LRWITDKTNESIRADRGGQDLQARKKPAGSVSVEEIPGGP